MSLCTICSLDPCPHLKVSGGSSGAIAVGIKYAPSSKPSCPICDRVHRNIGLDTQPVCAWRAYSKAKGEDFVAFTPDAVEEFARWYKAGGWTLPVKKTGVRKPATPKASPVSTMPEELPVVTVMTTDDGSSSAVPVSITVPTFDELEDDEPVTATLPVYDTGEDKPAVVRKTAPSFSTSKEEADAAVTTI